MHGTAWRAVAAVVLLAGAAAGDEPRVARVELGVPAFDSALNPDTGGLAVVVPAEDRVVLYPKFAATRGTGEPVAAKVGKLPVAVAFKKYGTRAYFLVACRDAGEVAVLDAGTLELVKSIPVAGGGPVALASSANPEDRYALYTATAPMPGRPPAVLTGRIDLETLSDAGKAPDVLSDQTEYAPSHDGALVHFRFRGQANGKHAVQTRAVPGPAPPGAGPAAAYPEGKAEGPGVVADPRGEFVVGGVIACDLRTGKEVARLPFAPLAASATRPLLFGIKDDALAAVSTNSFKVVGAAPLPLGKHDLRAGRRLDAPDQSADAPLVYRPRVLEDRAAKAVLVCVGKTILVVPEAVLDLPDEPVLGVGAAGRPEFVVGRRGEFPLRPAGGARAELVAGPDGLVLADGVLTWTPGPAAAGAHPATVRLSAGGATRVVRLTLLVRRGAVELPFDPAPVGPGGRLLALSPDGKTAAAAGPVRDPNDLGKVTYRVAVIDLSGGKVAAAADLPARPAAAVGPGHVYVALPGPDVLLALGAGDLREVRRAETPHPVELVTPVGDGYVAVTGGGRTTVLSVPDLRPASLPVPLPAPANPAGPTPVRPGPLDHLLDKKKPSPEEKEQAAALAREGIPPVWTGDGWWYRGVLYAAAPGAARAVIAPRDFWTPVRHVRPHDWKGMDADPPGYGGAPGAAAGRWYTPWGVTVEGRELVAGGQVVGRLPPGAPPGDGRPFAAAVLADHPAVATLSVSTRQTDDGPVASVELAFADLAASPVARFVLAGGPPAAVGASGPVSLAAVRGRVVAVVGRHVYVLPVPEEAAGCLPPMRFLPEYPTQVASAAGETRLAVPKWAGASGAVELVLSREPEGLKYDAKAGRLVFTADDLVARLTREVGDRVARSPGLQPGRRGDVLDGYLGRASGAFERLTGRKPAGIPVWVPFGVVATGGGRRTEAEFGFFVDLPLAGVLDRADDVAGGAESAEGPGATGGVTDLSREHVRLGKRVAELEEKVEALGRKIRALQKALEADHRPEK